MTRFATVLAALTPGHPLSVHIDPMAVKADFDRNAKAMELNVDQLGLIEFNSQVAQSIDRSLILAGVTKERHAKVSFASQPNMQTWAIAKTLRTEEHTYELKSHMRLSYAVLRLKKK